jgi:DNA-binding PadR family transcriptional regulator
MTTIMTHDEIKAAGFTLSRFASRGDARVSNYLYCGNVLIGAIDAVTVERERWNGRKVQVRTGWAVREPRTGSRDLKRRPTKTGFKTVPEAASWLIQKHEDALGLAPREERDYLAADWTPLNEHERWVRRTRESVARLIVEEWYGGPVNAAGLTDNLDITTYYSGIGFIDRRSEAEVYAALNWMAKVGLASVVAREDRDPELEPRRQKQYQLTDRGLQWAQHVKENPTLRDSR